METKKKKEYANPTTDVMALKLEDIICLSGNRNPYGNPIPYNWD